MKIALLATGDELINGDTLNTNAHHLAHSLHSEGLEIGKHVSCSDEEQDILDCLQFLGKDHEVLIITGGLGPTSDDRTRFALAKYMQTHLQEYPEAKEHIRQWLLNSHLVSLAGNIQQTLFPPGFELLANPFGTAMGCYGQWSNKMLILLPGPPRECLPMFHTQVLPRLQALEHSATETLKWRVFNVAESELGHMLDTALKNDECTTGYRLEMPYVECKVRCKPALRQYIENIVQPLLAPYIICPVEKKASQLLIETIIKNGKSISIVDEVTGGHLQVLLQNPQTHHLLHFLPQAQADIRCHFSGLNEFWEERTKSGMSSMRLTFTLDQKVQEEEHSLPYRSSNIVFAAAEWLSFRLLHFLNQLH